MPSQFSFCYSCFCTSINLLFLSLRFFFQIPLFIFSLFTFTWLVLSFQPFEITFFSLSPLVPLSALKYIRLHPHCIDIDCPQLISLVVDSDSGYNKGSEIDRLPGVFVWVKQKLSSRVLHVVLRRNRETNVNVRFTACFRNENLMNRLAAIA